MRLKAFALFGTLAVLASLVTGPVASADTTYDTTTLAGKVASVNGTAGLQIRMSAFIEEQANANPTDVLLADGDNSSVISSALDGTQILPPAVTVNQDTNAAPQNETAIAVDPNNPYRVVGSANDYVTRTWSCTVNGTPCSKLGDGYSGTYYSNDGGSTWCCKATDPQHLGTLIPGVTRLAGGIYDAGGDPAVAFDSQGNVYYSGLGFDRHSAPNTVTLSRGTFDSSGALTWGAPTFINPTTSPSTFNDKEWVAADSNPLSPFRDRVYVTFTRFIFSATTGAYVQSPIFEAHSSDGGATFSGPKQIGSPVNYSQGSRPVVGPDGTVYVFWDGSTRLAALDSTYMVKSTDGGATWSAPVNVSDLNEISTPADAKFRVNSFPAAAAGPDGKLYVAWSTQVSDPYGGHAAAVYSTSHDGGTTWSSPALVNPALDAKTRVPVGYTKKIPVTADTRRVDTFWPGVAVTPGGTAYISYYAADVVSPWHLCGTYTNSLQCSSYQGWVNNARLDYVVTNLGMVNGSQTVTGHPINTRYQFRGGFIGDYTGLAAGSDGRFHALWTDTNNQQTAYWWYGSNLGGITVNQQDAATATGS